MCTVEADHAHNRRCRCLVAAAGERKQLMVAMCSLLPRVRICCRGRAVGKARSSSRALQSGNCKPDWSKGSRTPTSGGPAIDPIHDTHYRPRCGVPRGPFAWRRRKGGRPPHTQYLYDDPHLAVSAVWGVESGWAVVYSWVRDLPGALQSRSICSLGGTITWHAAVGDSPRRFGGASPGGHG